MDTFWFRPETGKPPTPFAGSEANESRAALSPDGRWVAYVSDESGRQEVFLQSFPGPGRRQQVSARGGSSPVWSPKGRELYFREGKGVLAAGSTPRAVSRSEGPGCSSRSTTQGMTTGCSSTRAARDS